MSFNAYRLSRIVIHAKDVMVKELVVVQYRDTDDLLELIYHLGCEIEKWMVSETLKNKRCFLVQVKSQKLTADVNTEISVMLRNACGVFMESIPEPMNPVRCLSILPTNAKSQEIFRAAFHNKRCICVTPYESNISSNDLNESLSKISQQIQAVGL